MKKKGQGQKGTFGELELPVSRRYLFPASRRPMLLLGALLGGAVLAFLLVDLFAAGGRFVSNGPLSSNHAAFGSDCGNCHFAAGRTVSNDKCSVCHEKFGDRLGVFTFAAHYLYRSDDFRRVVPSDRERPCFACHTEHEGRAAQITRVPDGECLRCHDFGSFNDRHPEFDFVAEALPDDAGLRFPHAHHVREVGKREGLEDVERACLYCHNAEPDGKGFAPLDFDRHCDACHLGATVATPALPIRQDDRLGVETVAAILDRGAPGSRWALFSNPREFRIRGDSLVKGPLHHRDPWIEENLRTLRRRLFTDAGLADLLAASPDAPADDLRRLYEEAVATLEAQVLELRGSPDADVQAELERIESALEGLRRRLDDPYAALDETRFMLALDQRNPELTDEEAAAIDSLAADLTAPCRQCHLVADATIARVQTGQRVLRRAEFDHRAHILQRRCLDCHRRIPIAEGAATAEKLAPEVDSAAIQNLPGIETCRECHTPALASQTCVTCHYFHPNKSHRSELLLYLDRGAG